MPDKNPNKVVTFSEIDAASITQRYDATTVLTVLQEISHYPDWKFDWNELVKKTSSGISSAREYQLLWRHLAYRYSLPENLDEEDDPMDDDSDLDCELETLPSVSAESISESSACVKVMIASRTLKESTPSSSTIEAPLTVKFPVCRSYRTRKESSQSSNLMEQTGIMFPVTVHRQTLSTGSSTDALDTKGTFGGTNASKRKRKAWSEEEDNQLRAAVQKWGEGNWATMAKGDDFPIKRSATQLSQRWSTLRKKDGNVNSGITVPTNTPSATTDNYLATRHSLNLALDMPFKKLTAPGMTDPGRMSIKNQGQSSNPVQVSTVCNFVPPQRPSQQACGAPAKSKLASEHSLMKCNAMLARETKPATVNSGAQIVSPKLASENTVSKCNAMLARETKPATVNSGAQIVSPKLASENTVSKCNAMLARETKPAIVNSGAQIVSPKLASENTVSKCNAMLARETKAAIVNSGAQIVSPKLASQNTVSKCNAISAREAKPAIVKSGAQTVLPKLASQNTVSMCNAISAREAKSAIINSGAQTVSRSNAMPQAKFSQAKVDDVPQVKVSQAKVDAMPQVKVSQAKVVHVVPAGSPLTNTSISAGLPSDQKDKHVTSVKAEEKRVSVPASVLKENVKEVQSTTQVQVDCKLDKAKLDLDKARSTPSEKNLEPKAVTQNPGGCEGQGSVKNSNLTPKVTTENGNDNLNKASQDLNQDKNTSLVEVQTIKA